MLLFSQMARRLLLFFLLAGGLSLTGKAQVALEAANRPNIVLIVADDLGYGDLGCYGQKLVKTPNLDRLAGEGTRFTQFYAGSPLGNASRAALMTGRHTGHSNIRGISNIASSLFSSDVTIAEMLQDAGYLTGAIGKWAMGDAGSSGVPNNQGFKQWVGFLTGAHAQMYYPPYLYRNSSLAIVAENQDGKKDLYAPDLLIDSAVSFVRLSSPTPHRKEKHFFLYYAPQLPRANADLGRVEGNGMEIPSDSPYSAERWAQPDKNRAAMVTRLDADIGKLMERLKTSKVDTNTVVIFTSDNGPWRAGGANPAFFNATGGLRGQRGDMYEGGLRVPLIVWWPGRVAASNVVETPCAMWDILPTIADLTGTGTKETDGRSLLSALKGQKIAPPDYLYWELHHDGFTQAVRHGDWKGIRSQGKRMELYNLGNDPQEKKDLAAQKPDEVKKISDLMAEAHRDSDLWPVSENPAK